MKGVLRVFEVLFKEAAVIQQVLDDIHNELVRLLKKRKETHFLWDKNKLE